MSHVRQLPGRSLPSVVLSNSLGAQSRHSLVQAKPVTIPQRPRTDQVSRIPIAPAMFRIPAVPKVLQPKTHNAPHAAHTRPAMGVASGVVQANVIGGTDALQSRLNSWNTKLTRVGSTEGQRSNGAILPRASRASNGSPAIQRKSGHGVEAFRVPLRPKSGGLPMPDDVRAKMETAFGTDFSDVRVHIGQEASSLGAIAYTWGTNIHFAPGQYNPHTLQGQKLLGHELWHVVQQKNGRVKNPFGGGVAVVQDHALEAEADRMGIKAALTQVVLRANK